MKIFLTHTSEDMERYFCSEAVEELSKLGTVQSNPLNHRLSSIELATHAGDADIIVSEWATGMDKAFIERAANLKAFIRSGVEIRNVDFDEANKARIIIVNTPGQYVNPVVELTLGLMIAASRKLVAYSTSLRSGVKLQVEITPELCGKTLSIIGLGAIGRRLAVVAEALGMRVLGYDPYVTVTPDGVELHTMEALLREGDYISLHAGWTDETKKLIGGNELALMKPTAYLINTSRGALVDEEALYAALASGLLAGAALDVFSNEPEIVGNRLLELPNVIATPHIGGFSPETMKRQAFLVVEAVKEIISGRLPKHTLNSHVFDTKIQTKG